MSDALLTVSRVFMIRLCCQLVWILLTYVGSVLAFREIIQTEFG